MSVLIWNPLHEVAKVLEFQLEHHSFQRNPRADLLQNEALPLFDFVLSMSFYSDALTSGALLTQFMDGVNC